MANVDIYTSSSCPYCIRAKQLLESKNVKYRELVIDDDVNLIAESIERSNGKRTVPQIFIENCHIGGYDELNQLHNEGKLDAMLG